MLCATLSSFKASKHRLGAFSFYTLVGGPDGKGLDCKSIALKSSVFDSRTDLQYGDTARCGLGSHKPEEIVRVYLAPPNNGPLAELVLARDF